MTPKQIYKLIQQYTKVTLEKCEGERLHNLERVDDDELEAVSLSIIGRLEDNAKNLINNDFSEVTRVANSLLLKTTLPFQATPLHSRSSAVSYL